MFILFLSNHFELIVALQVYYMIGMLVIMLFLQVRHLRIDDLDKGLREILYYLIVIGETALLVSIIYVFASNLAPKPVLDFSSRILPSTRWAKDPTPIYFISGFAANELVSIRPDGSGRTTVFKAGGDSIRSYHFSPDGQDILIVTTFSLQVYHLKDKSSELLDRLDFSPQSKQDSVQEIKGTIDGVRLSPDGSKVCYRMSRWSSFASQEAWFIYDRAKKQKHKIISQSRALGTLIWDQSGENLYYPWFETLNSPAGGNPYKVKVYRIPLATLTAELAFEFNFDKPELSKEHLSVRGINLDFDVERLSFSRAAKSRYAARSAKGSLVAIDDEDILYYVRSRWWRKRLYKIPRVPINSDIERYQYQGGQLAVQDLRWLPEGRYVIMEHYFFGILILDPETGKIGILDNQRGDTFGWYEPVTPAYRQAGQTGR